MSVIRNPWSLCLGILACGGLGYFLARTAVPAKPTPPRSLEPSQTPRNASIEDDPVRFRAARQRRPAQVDTEAFSQGALIGQRSLQFPDQASMDRFLARASGKIQILDRSDALRALRVGFLDPNDLNDLLDGSEEPSFIFPVSAPAPATGDVQSGAAPLGATLHDWLGIQGDNSQWGKGVSIAVLDTAIQPHSTFSNPVRSVTQIDSSHGHGTAVASVIAGSHPAAPGVAPASSLLSIGIADENGMSDSFELAKGILTALENGADLINISMGSGGDSSLVRQAVQQATDQGVLIIAAAGNNGTDRISYPAANDGVIAVGAVDAQGNHLDFSNTGESIAVAAPGYSIQAAWPDEKAILATGTSFSAPIITGSIAAVMTASESKPITASQAWGKIQSVLNEGGPAGIDPQFGAGMPDLGRVLQLGTPGIRDAAVASHQVLPATSSAPYGLLETTIQNRGTETLINTSVEISLDGRRTLSNLTSLAPNQSQSIRIPLTAPPGESGLTASSTVSLTGNQQDIKPANDQRKTTLSVPTPASN